MGTDFKASEIFEIAIQVEKHGEKFYRHAATICDDKKIKEMFEFLANEEVKHRKTIDGMLSKIEHYEPPEKYPGEYCKYLKAYAENQVFSDKEFDEKMKEIDTVADAIEFAIEKEIQSILYYLEMRNLVPEGPQRKEIDRLVEEERRHYLRLNEAKRTL
jgi:rubrerythrin